jgi:hypothetical protein
MEENPDLALSLPRTMQHTKPDSQASTCRKLTALEVCEFAYREVMQTPLNLSDAEFDHAAIKAHLEETACEVCLRWYRNARRTYRRLQLAGKPSVRSNEAPIERRVVAVRQSATCRGKTGSPENFFFLLDKVENGSQLNALNLTLDCRRTNVITPANPSGWEVTLQYYSREKDASGNDPVLLQQFDDCRVTVKILPQAGEPIIRETQLRLDEDGNLVSPPCSLAGIDPARIAAIALLSWNKADGASG